jgi:hypothetical protein
MEVYPDPPTDKKYGCYHANIGHQDHCQIDNRSNRDKQKFFQPAKHLDASCHQQKA